MVKANDDLCEQVVPVEHEPCHRLGLTNEFVRVFAVEVPPHARTLCHRHATDYMVYVAGDSVVASTSPGKKAKTIRYRNANCELLQAGLVHFVENLSDKPFRNYVVELLPEAASLRRGARPRVATATNTQGGSKSARVRTVLAKARLAVFAADLESSAQICIAGSALVASLYGGHVAVLDSKTGTSAALVPLLTYAGLGRGGTLESKAKLLILR